MGHKSNHSHHHKHKHKSHSKRSSSLSSISSSSSTDNYSHHSHKRKKHHHHHKNKKENIKSLKKQNDIMEIERKERENILIGPSLPIDKEEKINDGNNSNLKNKEKIIGPLLPSVMNENNNEVNETNIESINSNEKKIIGPLVPSFLQNHLDNDNKDSQKNDTFTGPLLPSNNLEQKLIGPLLPQSSMNNEKNINNEDDNNDIIGPLPLAPGHELTEEEETQRIIEEFEERADRMKRKLEGADEPEKPKKLVRDEWMTTLPEDNLLDRINVLKPRQFRKNGISQIDRSGWTDTPADKLKNQKEVSIINQFIYCY